MTATNETLTTPVDSSPEDSCETSKKCSKNLKFRHETSTAVPEESIVTRESVLAIVAVDEEAVIVIDGKASAVIDEEAAEPSKSEKSPSSISNHSYISRIGKIYGRAFIKDVIYPLCYNINPLE